MTYWRWMNGPGYRNYMQTHPLAAGWLGLISGAAVMGVVASFLVADDLKPAWNTVIMVWVIVMFLGSVVINVLAFRWSKRHLAQST